MKRRNEELEETASVLESLVRCEGWVGFVDIRSFFWLTSINKTFLHYQSSKPLLLALYCHSYGLSHHLIQETIFKDSNWKVFLKERYLQGKVLRRLQKGFDEVEGLGRLSLEETLTLVNEVKHNLEMISYHQQVSRNRAALKETSPLLPLLAHTSFTSFCYAFNKIQMVAADLTIQNEWTLYSPTYGIPIPFSVKISLKLIDGDDYCFDALFSPGKEDKMRGSGRRKGKVPGNKEKEKEKEGLVFKGIEEGLLGQYMLFCGFANLLGEDDEVFKKAVCEVRSREELEERGEKLAIHLLHTRYNINPANFI